MTPDTVVGDATGGTDFPVQPASVAQQSTAAQMAFNCPPMADNDVSTARYSIARGAGVR
jgi:hypothetical protein